MTALESIPQPVERSAQTTSLPEFIAVLRRQAKPMILVAGLVLGLVLLVALTWPPTYVSSATILIEEQEIPQDMVRSTITSYATQQIEVIRQRVLTLSNIMEIVTKFELYPPEELDRMTKMQISREFIAAVNLELLNAEVIDPRSGRPTQATIAFILEFSASSPNKAMEVTNELVNLFLNEHLRARSAKAASTSDFLRQEAGDLAEEVSVLEKKIAEFKAEHASALPESFIVNIQNMSRYQSELLAAEARLQALATQEPQLESQLANTNAYAPTILPSGESVLADVDRLKVLQSDYRRKAARYSESHPDVISLSREIDTLASQVGHAGNKDDLIKLLANRKDELVSLKSRYALDHPEVVVQARLVEQLSEQVARLDDSKPDVSPDNPAYVILDNQLKAFQLEKTSLEKRIVRLNGLIEELNQSALQAPVVEREYSNLLRNREVATAKYLDLRVKLKEAELAGELEAGRMAQRFTLIDPPAAPQEPVSPNRPAIVFLGVLLAAGAGFIIALILESADQSVRSARGLANLMGIPPVATIPYMESPAEKNTRRPQRRLYLLFVIGIILALIFLALVHSYYKPIDVLWFVVLRKLGLG